MLNTTQITAPTGALPGTPQPDFGKMFGEFACFMQKEQHNPIEPMKNHIIQSIIEAASMPVNKSGIAAINQLILEVASEFPGVEPSGFIFQEVRPTDQEVCYRYHMSARLVDPWPLESKVFSGGGWSIVEAMESLREELAAYFIPVAESLVLEGIEVRTANNELVPDRRTEFAA